MNRYKLAIGLLLAVAAGLLVLTLTPSQSTVSDEPKGARAKREAQPAAQAAREKTAPNKDGRAQLPPTKLGRRAEASAPQPDAPDESAPAMDAGAGSSAERPTPRDQAVTAWESLVDRVIAQTDVPAAEQAKRVKEAFDQLDKQDQMDGIHRSLNLFPDEQFPALYDILFDKTEDPEVLDAIFSDALNRPEELKNPLMKELVKDKEHPCFFESARILDVIGELDVKPAPTASP